MTYAVMIDQAFMLRKHKKRTLIAQGSQNGDGGIRTHGRFDPSNDFESLSL